MRKIIKGQTRESVEKQFSKLRKFGWKKVSDVVFEPDYYPSHLLVIERDPFPYKKKWSDHFYYW